MRVVMLQHRQHLLSGSGKGYEVIGQAALDQEGLQTMRALAHNMAWLLNATGGKPAPGRGDEPWAPMHFIR